MKILIIGCGLTGKAITFNLLKNSKVECIGLYSRTLKSSKALADKLKNSRIKILENLETIKEYDYIIMTLSGISDSSREESFFKSKTTYEIRQMELKYNLGALVGLIDYLKNISSISTIIVVTNPMDEITNYLRIILKNNKVIGFGLDLDARRYSKLLDKSVYCIGSHGKAIPLIKLSSEKEYKSLYEKTDSELMIYLKKNGIPADVAGEIFSSFFNKLTGDKEEIIHVSAYLKKEFEGIKSISISLPYRVKQGKILGVAKITLNSIEKKIFIKSIKELKKSINHILITHNKLAKYK